MKHKRLLILFSLIGIVLLYPKPVYANVPVLPILYVVYWLPFWWIVNAVIEATLGLAFLFRSPIPKIHVWTSIFIANLLSFFPTQIVFIFLFLRFNYWPSLVSELIPILVEFGLYSLWFNGYLSEKKGRFDWNPKFLLLSLLLNAITTLIGVGLFLLVRDPERFERVLGLFV